MFGIFACYIVDSYAVMCWTEGCIKEWSGFFDGMVKVCYPNGRFVRIGSHLMVCIAQESFFILFG